MNEYRVITLREKAELKETAAEWFHSKWGVPKEAYLACMEDYLNNKTEYGWYLCLAGEKIIGGLGVVKSRLTRPFLLGIYFSVEIRRSSV